MPSKLLKVILLGNGDVGKSSVMNRYVNNRFDVNSSHTIGVEFLNKDIVHGEKYTLQIWDTAGQERFRSLRTPFYRGSDICLLTFALNDRSSFRDLDIWRREFFYYGDVGDEDCFPFMLLGNKCDLPEDSWVVSREDALEWCQKNGRMENGVLVEVPYLETSAQDAINIEKGFQQAVDLWKELDTQVANNLTRDRLTNDMGDQNVDLNAKARSTRASCCF